MLISPTEIIKTSLNLYKNNWRKFVPYLILLFLPTLIISLLGAASLYLYVYLPSSNIISSLVLLAVIVASLIFTLWVAAAFTKTLYLCANQQAVGSWKETFSASSRLIWPIIITSILVGLIVLGGTILFIIPGIIFTIWYVFTYYIIVVEEKKGLEALKISKALVVGRWWSIVWRLLLPGLVFGIGAAIIVGLLDKGITLIFSIQSLYYILISALINALINSLITPLTAGAGLTLYLSAKNNPISTPISPIQKTGK